MNACRQECVIEVEHVCSDAVDLRGVEHIRATRVPDKGCSSGPTDFVELVDQQRDRLVATAAHGHAERVDDRATGRMDHFLRQVLVGDGARPLDERPCDARYRSGVEDAHEGSLQKTIFRSKNSNNRKLATPMSPKMKISTNIAGVS